MASDAIDGFRTLDVIGAGAFGAVYRAVHERSGRLVALKLVRFPDPEGQTARRFRREMRLAAAVQHPNIVKVYDAGPTPDGAFLAMELLEGKDLKDLIGCSPPMGAAFALAIASRVADALASLHGRGIIHRDVKPANVFLCADRTVKVVDFGLACGEECTLITEDGTFVGTVAYGAPEVLCGQRHTPASDLFGLGCVLINMLTAGRFIEAQLGPQLLARRVRHGVDVPEELTAVQPEPVCELLGQLVEHDAERRPPNAEAVRDALEAILTDVYGASWSEVLESGPQAFVRPRTAADHRSTATPAQHVAEARGPSRIGVTAAAFAIGSIVCAVGLALAPVDRPPSPAPSNRPSAVTATPADEPVRPVPLSSVVLGRDGTAMVLVPGGRIESSADPSQRVVEEAFFIDRRAVTKSLYRRYCGRTPGALSPAVRPGDGEETMRTPTRADARRYCEWAAKRLPTAGQRARAVAQGIAVDAEEWAAEEDPAVAVRPRSFRGIVLAKDASGLMPVMPGSR